jgi:hypothetical protein
MDDTQKKRDKSNNMKTQKPKGKGLPKFDTTGWLSVGIFFSLMLVIFSLASILSAPSEPFFPFVFSNILGMVLGLGLGIHCVDMIIYRRNKRLSRSKERIKEGSETDQKGD